MNTRNKYDEVFFEDKDHDLEEDDNTIFITEKYIQEEEKKGNHL